MRKINDKVLEKFKNDNQDSLLNICHAANLIHVNQFNILADPIFNHLNPILYQSKTQAYPI